MFGRGGDKKAQDKARSGDRRARRRDKRNEERAPDRVRALINAAVEQGRVTDLPERLQQKWIDGDY